MKNKKAAPKKLVTKAKAVKKPVVKPVKTKKIQKPVTRKINAHNLSIYVYWLIIIVFISATLFILGARYMQNYQAKVTVMEEEVLLQSDNYITSGKVKLKDGDLSGAISDLSEALKTQEPSADAFTARGKAYMESGEYKFALGDLDTAIALDAKNIEALYNRSNLFVKMGEYNMALSDINAALAVASLTGSDAVPMRDIYAARGKLNLWLKNWKGAIADYTNSLSRPEGVVNPAVYAERAEAYTAVGEFTSAIEDYSTAIRIVSEQIPGVTTDVKREQLSRSAMEYFKKIAALNIQIGDLNAARENLESAYIIAAALNDQETISVLSTLIMEL